MGAKKPFPAFADEVMELFDVISVSAGLRGLQVLLSPADYLRAVGGFARRPDEGCERMSYLQHVLDHLRKDFGWSGGRAIPSTGCCSSRCWSWWSSAWRSTRQRRSRDGSLAEFYGWRSCLRRLPH